MAEYKLTAQLGDTFEVEVIDAYDEMSATIQAIGLIMDNAVEDELWADGEIRMYAPDGRLLREMEAKV